MRDDFPIYFTSILNIVKVSLFVVNQFFRISWFIKTTKYDTQRNTNLHNFYFVPGIKPQNKEPMNQ